MPLFEKSIKQLQQLLQRAEHVVSLWSKDSLSGEGWADMESRLTQAAENAAAKGHRAQAQGMLEAKRGRANPDNRERWDALLERVLERLRSTT